MSPQPTLPVVELEVRPKAEALEATTESGLTTFERLARDPSVDVDKLEKLMLMHERATARLAQEMFNGAMAAAQKDMRPVAADAHNPQTRSRYASYAALDNAIRPIYTRHGFGLSFNTGESPIPEHVRVICDVSHVGGHEKAYHVDMPADGKGAKGGDVMTKTHAVGAALSYGCRYLLKLIFNVAVGEDDRDGNAPKEPPAKPTDYDKFFRELSLTVPNGPAALQAEFQKGSRECRDYLASHDSARLAELKEKARKAKS